MIKRRASGNVSRETIEQLENAEIRGKLKDGDKDYTTECMVCGAAPTVHPTELCGPCCFGEAETINGNW